MSSLIPCSGRCKKEKPYTMELCQALSVLSPMELAKRISLLMKHRNLNVTYFSAKFEKEASLLSLLMFLLNHLKAVVKLTD